MTVSLLRPRAGTHGRVGGREMRDQRGQPLLRGLLTEEGGGSSKAGAKSLEIVAKDINCF